MMNLFSQTSKKHVTAQKAKGLQHLRGLAICAFTLLGIFTTNGLVNAQQSDNNNEESKLARSIPVNYEGKAPKQAVDRFARETNEAQQAAISDLQQINAAGQVRKTREQVIAERKSQVINESVKQSLPSAAHSQSLQSANYVEFDIYSASSRLLSDNDYDGFHRTFSITFDADVYSQYVGERALVFADLYLSHNGGPWELYYTTDSFIIQDDISEDEFEVLTTLDVGYRTRHYDVLIDLYEVGYSDIVATISGNEVDDLYALPLESADRDTVVVESSSSVYVSGGSASIFVLLGLVFILLIRNKKLA